MKNTLAVVGILLTFAYLPFSFFMQFLVYQKIGATELMWFLFWVNIPFMILLQIVGKALERLK